MSDPFWFLENLEETESGKSKKETSESNDKSKVEPISELDGLTLGYSQDSDVKYFDQEPNQEKEVENGKNQENLLIEDENKKFESSIIDFSKDATNVTDIPEIKISIDPDSINKLLENNGLTDEELAYLTNKGNIKITVSTNDNSQSFGKEKDNSTVTENNLNNVWNSADEGGKPKIYVILKDKNSTAGNGNQDSKFYTEVGSTVVNLNDLISNESQTITGNEEISTAVKTFNIDGSNENGKSKVELVITVKDKRKNKAEKFENKRNTRSRDVFDQFVDSRHPRFNDPIDTSLTESWDSTEYYGQEKKDWTKESRDSFIRESDGARCYRTVTVTPQGRSVKTECYDGERSARRRANGRSYRTSGFGSFWRELDDEFTNLALAARRMFFF